MIKRAGPIGIVLLVVGAAAGCNGETGHDKTAPVSGRVTYAGEPVPQGQIMFYPADGRRMAIGVIDASGNYELTTFDPQDGAVLGKHTVVVDAVRDAAPGPSSPEEEGEVGVPSVERLTPAEYAHHQTSPLEAEVKDQDNVINFDIPK